MGMYDQANPFLNIFKSYLYDSLPFLSLSSAKAPTGHPNEEDVNRKHASLLLFPIVPHAPTFSFSPESLRHKETSVEERDFLPEKKRPSIKMITVQVFLKLLNLRKI